MEVDICNSYSPEYDEFVKRMPNTKLCHLFAWAEMVMRTFGHKSFYLVARDGNQVHGVLPLIQIKSHIFGNRLVSQAFGNYGGPLANGPDVFEALYTRAVELATEHGCESIEFRNLQPLNYDLHSQTDKVSMLLPLNPDPYQLWRNFNKHTRKHIRKAEKSGLTVVDGGLDLLDEFYEVWTIRMHQLGTPCYPRKLFRNIMETFSEQSRVFVVRLRGSPVGVQFAYYFNGMVECRWAATRIEYNPLSPNTLLCWSVIRYYCLTGMSWLDFGRSTIGSGQYKFKKQWGSQPVQLHYQYWTYPGHELSLVKPNEPKYKRKVELWKKLPLWATRLAGPYLSCSLP